MSPIEHLPDEERLPDVAETDLVAGVRGFVDAASSGRVTQPATVHAWAAHLGRLLAAVPEEKPRAQRWT